MDTVFLSAIAHSSLRGGAIIQTAPAQTVPRAAGQRKIGGRFSVNDVVMWVRNSSGGGGDRCTVVKSPGRPPRRRRPSPPYAAINHSQAHRQRDTRHPSLSINIISNLHISQEHDDTFSQCDWKWSFKKPITLAGI